MKKMLALIIAILMLAISASAEVAEEPAVISPIAADTERNVIVNGEDLGVSYIVNEDNITLLPLRAICEKLGFTITWDDETRMIEVIKLPMYITFTPDADGYTFAKTAPMPLGTKPVIKDGVTYVPAELFSDLLKYEVIIDGTATIYAPIEAKVTVKEAGEKSLTVEDPVRGEVIVHVGEDTLIYNAAGELIELSQLDTTKELTVIYGRAFTLSLPPQTTAVKISEN